LLLLLLRRSIDSSTLPLSSQGCLLLAATQLPLPLLCSAASSTLPLLLQALLMWGAAAPAKGLLLAAQPLALSGAGGVLGAGGPLLTLLRLFSNASTSVTLSARLSGSLLPHTPCEYSSSRAVLARLGMLLLLQVTPMPCSTSRQDTAPFRMLVW
jgi:hypothetical protein